MKDGGVINEAKCLEAALAEQALRAAIDALAPPEQAGSTPDPWPDVSDAVKASWANPCVSKTMADSGAGSTPDEMLARIREEFETVAKLGGRADIDSAMLVVSRALVPDETLREALADMLRFFGGEHPGPDSYADCVGCKACEAARRALATPTKPEMQSVHPAAVSGKEKP